MLYLLHYNYNIYYTCYLSVRQVGPIKVKVKVYADKTFIH